MLIFPTEVNRETPACCSGIWKLVGSGNWPCSVVGHPEAAVLPFVVETVGVAYKHEGNQNDGKRNFIFLLLSGCYKNHK